MALSGDGLFGRARNSADKYKKAQEDEQKLISEIGKEMNSEYVGAYIEGYEPKEGKYEVTEEQSGTGENKTFTTDKDMKWRIWDYDGTILRLIADKPTKDTLKLVNKVGYNEGVYIINEICRKCYNSNETGVEVRNLRRSDIEEVSNYDYTKYKHRPNEWIEVVGNSDDKSLIYYGEIKSYTENFQAPVMWSSHDAIWNYECNKDTKKGTGDPSSENPWEYEFENTVETNTGSTTNNNTNFKQSFYHHNYTNKEEEFINSNYYDMIFKSENGKPAGYYWLAGRYVRLNQDKCSFGLHMVVAIENSFSVFGDDVFYSDR